MKKINKGNEPHRFGVFIGNNPEALWEKKPKDSNIEAFRCSSARYQETQQALRTEQGNICAYCEQDLLSGSNGNVDDCRIEHFHPKSQRENGEPNWALLWSNLLAVCCGGNQSKVTDAINRFDDDPKNYSCDVPKGNNVLDDVILNPLNLEFENIWTFKRSTGEIAVNNAVCQRLGICTERANNTIIELNLNSDRLKRGRRSVLNELNDQITERISLGLSVVQARSLLASSILSKNQAGDWPSFFSSIRFYLGSEAEAVLQDPI